MNMAPGKILHILLITLMSVSFCFSQQPSAGSGAPAPANQSKDADQAKEDISGMYSFLREGEFVQINIEAGTVVTGFVSRFGDTESDKGAFLDQFFNKASLEGERLTFTTKAVHGVWFEFDGNIARGPGKSPNDDGYRIIRGKLTQYTRDAANKVIAKSQSAEFKSFPQDYAEDKTAPVH